MARLQRTTRPGNTDEPVGRVKVYDRIYLAYVKDNQDIQRMGRLKVWIPELGSEPTEKDSWVTVSYASPFAGATDPTFLGNRVERDDQSQTSYGWWGVPPDLENQVLVFFINGDPARGVWFACLYQQNMNHMVPGVPARSENYKQQGRVLPVTEYNKRALDRPRDDVNRPESTVQSRGIASQGLINDGIRGLTSSGARRETPSQVYGFLSPGPTRPGSQTQRTGGSSFYMDDSEGSEHVRIRTKTGAQILLDETNGIVYAINKLGTSWIQMDAEGNVDIFGAKSFSVRSQEDVNIRADRDVNIEAGRDVNLKAAKDFKNSDAGSVGKSGDETGGDLNIDVKGSVNWRTDGNLHITTDRQFSVRATQRIDLRSTGTLNMDGSVTNVQKGASNPGTPKKVRTRPKTNVLSTFRNDYDRNTEPVRTAVSRWATFEPCPEHTAQGDPYEPSVVSDLLRQAGRTALSDDDLDLSIIESFNEDLRSPGSTAFDTDLDSAAGKPPVSIIACGEISRIDYGLKLSQNFALSSLSTAALWSHPIRSQHGLTASQIICNLRNLAVNVLEPIWVQYPNFRINSGFRTSTGGRSQHERGQAADIQWPGIRGQEYLKRAQWIRDNVAFDQLLFEHGNSIWLHLSFDAGKRRQRYQVSTMINNRFEPGLRLYYS